MSLLGGLLVENSGSCLLQEVRLRLVGCRRVRGRVVVGLQVHAICGRASILNARALLLDACKVLGSASAWPRYWALQGL